VKCETGILQDETEINSFIEIVKQENVRSYLEIGSKHGGSLWRIANSMPIGSRVVSVDLPQADGSFKNSQPNLEECVEELLRRGYDAYLIIGDSTDQKVVSAVRELGPFDLCFIDGYHTEPFVRADWDNYGPMARMVAFHDIGWLADRGHSTKKATIEVPKVWREIKQNYRWREIMECPRDNGIGILWRH
jgi:hypothetical protein